MTDGNLAVTQDCAVATITISNPPRRNAMTLSMWQSFEPTLARLADDSTVTVVVIRGAEGHFSAGADIGSLDSILDPSVGLGGWVSRAEEAIAAFPKPTVAAIEGICFGGGWEVAAACDLRVAATSSSLAITPAKIGIIYPLSGITRLVNIVGPARAKYLLFTGNSVSATEAYEMGLITSVVADEHFPSSLESLCADLVARSQLSIHSTKQLIGALVSGDGDVEQLYARWWEELKVSEDPSIGAAAFAAREKPRFVWGRD
ncbi:enoyl-CoA hydratase/isomerase family protein [Salinibacterium sp. SWN167]|uniref:enoyl-CoA hydratase/isomerase family protein n=1 Tax=Salinibacterium sp. SWN167 TaxID=2792054 RepID=UPI0018CFE191|nr:enoyl-CoA hydratase/isomerase family protein [Salinibacterium sp. SWN167]MBH0084036.1 enoyl-CoA hydratase/isomerase family protein [Salinibacterium sp. SWN167]